MLAIATVEISGKAFEVQIAAGSGLVGVITQFWPDLQDIQLVS